MTVEADSPLLSVLNESQMTRLKCITDNAATIVWITSTALKNCENPDTALVGGLSRALMLEQPSLNFFTLDVDGESDSVVTAQHVVAILAQAERGGFCDFEFVQRQGILNVSRFIPDETLNEDFRQRQGGHPVGRSLRDAKDCRLIIKNAGQFDTLMFVQELEEGPLKPDFVEVEVVSVGLNAKVCSVFVEGVLTERCEKLMMLRISTSWLAKQRRGMEPVGWNIAGSSNLLDLW